MHPASWLCQPAAASPPSQQELQAVLTRAEQLRGRSSQMTSALPGKSLGLLCTEPDSEDARLFLQAARGLGAYVALVPSQVGAPQFGAVQLARMGRLLGRLYDAVECQGMDLGAVRELGAAANVPVYAGLASPRHPIAGLADRLDSAAPLLDRRRWLIQAALLVTLA